MSDTLHTLKRVIYLVLPHSPTQAELFGQGGIADRLHHPRQLLFSEDHPEALYLSFNTEANAKKSFAEAGRGYAPLLIPDTAVPPNLNVFDIEYDHDIDDQDMLPELSADDSLDSSFAAATLDSHPRTFLPGTPSPSHHRRSMRSGERMVERGFGEPDERSFGLGSTPDPHDIITSVTDNQGMQKVGDVETIDVEMIDSSEALKEERKDDRSNALQDLSFPNISLPNASSQVKDDAKGRFEAPEGSVFPTPQAASKTSASSASSIAVREPPIKKISLKEWADRRRAKEAEKTHSIVVREGDAFHSNSLELTTSPAASTSVLKANFPPINPERSHPYSVNISSSSIAALSVDPASSTAKVNSTTSSAIGLGSAFPADTAPLEAEQKAARGEARRDEAGRDQGDRDVGKGDLGWSWERTSNRTDPFQGVERERVVMQRSDCNTLEHSDASTSTRKPPPVSSLPPEKQDIAVIRLANIPLDCSYHELLAIIERKNGYKGSVRYVKYLRDTKGKFYGMAAVHLVVPPTVDSGERHEIVRRTLRMKLVMGGLEIRTKIFD